VRTGGNEHQWDGRSAGRGKKTSGGTGPQENAVGIGLTQRQRGEARSLFHKETREVKEKEQTGTELYRVTEMPTRVIGARGWNSFNHTTASLESM